MKTGWKITVIVGIFLAVFTVIWLLTPGSRPQQTVEHYKQTLRDRGEKLEISEVTPPPVSPESNGVNLLESAFRLLPTDYTSSNFPPAMPMIAPGQALIGWQQPDLRMDGYPGFTNSWANALADAESNRPAVELVRQAVAYPALDFQLDYQKAFNLPLTHLVPMRKTAFLLSASVLCDLHIGDASSATTNLCTLLTLIQDEHEARLMISQLVRGSLANVAAAATWEFLQSTNLTDQDLAQVQAKWEQMEFIHSMEMAMTMERALMEVMFERARVSNAELSRLWTGAVPGGWTSTGDWWEDFQGRLKTARDQAGMTLWRVQWSYSDEMAFLESEQILLETLRTIETNRIFLPAYHDSQSRMAALGLTHPMTPGWFSHVSGMDQFQRIFSDDSVSFSQNNIRRTMVSEACRQIVITAIALKRYQLRHGNLPAQLSELAPELLPAIPRDPVDGQPLRYHRNNDGTFLLYSIGENGKDDGGDPTSSPAGISNANAWLNLHAHDWVWPQPATAAEIQSYYATPHK